jgi:hypothetical protein
MSADIPRDHRTKISVKADHVLAGLAHARGCDKQDISREWIEERAGQILHEATVVVGFAPREGKHGSDSE